LCVKKQREEKLKEKRQKAREKKRLSPASLSKKLDTIFSIYVRLLHADKNGYVNCFTCGRREYWRKIQNGHFQSRRFMSTRYHLGNCAPQCYACNVGMSGMQYEFGKRLDERFGNGFADEMVRLSREIKKFTPDEYVVLIEDFENAVKELRRTTGITD
jgi:hypothetical protein